jgi:hypothetical protein
MKKTVAILLALSSASAFASKARLEALGENKDGSYYIQDNRNMFLNPAAVNAHKDFVTMEHGTASSTANDVNASPRAEGGFFRSMGALNYGVYMGSQNDRVLNAMSTYATHAGSTSLTQSNPLDLFVGGEAGAITWGADVTYSTNEVQGIGTQKQTQDYWSAKVGAMMNNAELFVQYDIKNEIKGTAADANDKFEDKGNLRLGAGYMWNDLKFYGTWATYEYKSNDASANKARTDENSDWALGVGRAASINDKTKLFTKVEYNVTKTSHNFGGNPKFATANNYAVPVVVGLEHDAMSWLALRGSISQNVFGATDTDTSTAAGAITKTKTKRSNNTAAAAGATLTLGSLKIDGLIGTTGINRTATGTSAQGVLATDNLMTRIAFRYNF